MYKTSHLLLNSVLKNNKFVSSRFSIIILFTIAEVIGFNPPLLSNIPELQRISKYFLEVCIHPNLKDGANILEKDPKLITFSEKNDNDGGGGSSKYSN